VFFFFLFGKRCLFKEFLKSFDEGLQIFEGWVQR